MISFESSGSFDRTEQFLKKMSSREIFKSLEQHAQAGVKALASASPIDSGLTSTSWGYKIESSKRSTSVTWFNTNTETGVSVVIMLQYGHAVRGGGYVQGQDFINPAMKPIFDKIEADVWRVVTNS